MVKRVAHIGQFLGDYRITDELHTNAISRIFLGESRFMPQQFVAIKWFPNIRLDSQQEESFFQEMRFLQQLQHPHILSLVTAESDKGVPYLVTEYAPNGSLDKTMQHQARLPWDVDQALSIISQIGQALQYAHQQNIVHCNLKPQNILFDAQGQALLADFRLVSLSEPLQATTTYMAPEQILGTITRQCDQYALGCIAYEMLTGHTPYHSQSLQYPGNPQRLPRLLPPTHFNPDLPESIEQAILTALASEPALRHSDLQTFLNALGPATIFIEDQQTSNLSTNRAVAAAMQPFTNADFFGEAVAQPSPTSLAKGATYQGSGSYQPRSRFSFSKEQKILLAISCFLVLVIIAGGFSAFAATQQKPRAQTTPPSAHNNISTVGNTSTVLATPTPKPASPTPSATTKAVTLQSQPTASPTPTQPLNNYPSPTTQPTPSSTTASTLSVTPTQLSNANCLRRTNSSYLCTVQLSLNTTGRQSWAAHSVGVTAQIIPFVGTITAGHTTKVKIIIFDNCKHPGAFIFSTGHTSVSAIILWAC